VTPGDAGRCKHGIGSGTRNNAKIEKWYTQSVTWHGISRAISVGPHLRASLINCSSVRLYVPQARLDKLDTTNLFVSFAAIAYSNWMLISVSVLPRRSHSRTFAHRGQLIAISQPLKPPRRWPKRSANLPHHPRNREKCKLGTFRFPPCVAARPTLEHGAAGALFRSIGLCDRRRGVRSGDALAIVEAHASSIQGRREVIGVD
jgi:hypothetical protein